MRLSAHLEAFQTFVNGKHDPLGCKRSWVRIPPRRPILSNTYNENGVNLISLFVPIFPQERLHALGANSGHVLNLALANLLEDSGKKTARVQIIIGRFLEKIKGDLWNVIGKEFNIPILR